MNCSCLNVTFCLFRVAIFLSEMLMQSFTVCVMIGVSTDIFFSFFICFYLCTFLLFSILFRFYLCTVCTIFIIIIIIIIVYKHLYTAGLCTYINCGVCSSAYRLRLIFDPVSNQVDRVKVESADAFEPADRQPHIG